MKVLKKLLLLTPLIIFLGGCSDNNSNDASGSLDSDADNSLRSITMGILPSLDALPIIIAMEKGFFEAEGLEVIVEQFASARDRDIAFQGSPHIDGLVFDLVAASIYYEGGTHMVAASASTGLASILGNSDVTSLDDLYGNSILISRNTSMDFILHSALDFAGLTPDDVIIEEVPALPTRLEMLMSNQAGAATLPEPFATIGLSQGVNLLTTTRELGINPFIFAFRQEIAEEKREEIEAFFRAGNAAIEFLNTADREEFIDILINAVGYPAEFRDSLVLPEFLPFSTPSVENVERVLEWSRQAGLLTANLTADDIIFDVFGE